MTPFRLALWIAKFAVSLALLLVVIPAGLYFGGLYTVVTYQERQAAKVLRTTACSDDRALLQQITKEKADMLSTTGLPEGAVVKPMPEDLDVVQHPVSAVQSSSGAKPQEGYEVLPPEGYEVLPPLTDVDLSRYYGTENRPLKAGVGGNSQHLLWFFTDGSSMPLDGFVALTQKDIALTCN